MGIPDVPDDARRIVPSIHTSLGAKFAVLDVRSPRTIDVPAGGTVPPVPLADRRPNPLTDADGQVAHRGGGR